MHGKANVKVDVLEPYTEPVCFVDRGRALFLRRDLFRLEAPYGTRPWRQDQETGAANEDGAGEDENDDEQDTSSSLSYAFILAEQAIATIPSHQASTGSRRTGYDTVSPNWPQYLSEHARSPKLVPHDIAPLLNSLCENDTSQSLMLKVALRQAKNFALYIPPKCAFVISDISRFPDFRDRQFDFVLVDPPWPNLSAARAATYDLVDPYSLFKIPLKLSLAAGAVVCVWVTHKPKYRKFVVQKLFSAWGLECVSQWYWLKVTTSGAPIFDERLTNRKPYEILIVGRRVGNLTENASKSIPNRKFFASVPSAAHSQKPFLDSLVQDYLPKDARKLELFARIVRPGWVCWGNECLKFNDEAFLEEREYVFQK
ncbi:Methyltransferase-like protein 4 [Entophlyctis sp. JEL0112]|nr:Methyltransferase-like protein 4 [Entophlyctis sp. JEL0112]